MATVSEVSELDSGVASPETTPEVQDPLRTISPITSLDNKTSPPKSNSEKKSLESTSTEKIILLPSSDNKTSPPESNPEKKSLESTSTEKLIMLPSNLGNDLEDEDEDDNNLDESLAERLWGLTEMFPNSLRSVSSSFTLKSLSFIKASYQLSRQVVWISVSTSLLLFAPVMFEVERFNVEEMVKQDRNRLVLGPGSAMSGPPATSTPPASR